MVTRKPYHVYTLRSTPKPTLQLMKTRGIANMENVAGLSTQSFEENRKSFLKKNEHLFKLNPVKLPRFMILPYLTFLIK